MAKENRDRNVIVSNRQALDAATSVKPKDQWVQVTGLDTDTAEIVKFRLRTDAFFRFYDGAARRANSRIKVYSHSIISVE